MEQKTLLRERYEREYEYLSKQEVGSDEYNASMSRLNILEDKLNDQERFKKERKDRLFSNINEGVKTASGIVLPLVGLVAITAFEKNDTFTTSLRGIVNCFLPRKL